MSRYLKVTTPTHRKIMRAIENGIDTSSKLGIELKMNNSAAWDVTNELQRKGMVSIDYLQRPRVYSLTAAGRKEILKF